MKVVRQTFSTTGSCRRAWRDLGTGVQSETLSPKKGENMKQWSACACSRLDLVAPSRPPARNLKAVVIARARGDLKRESVSAALRSCRRRPDPAIGKRRTAVALAEETAEDMSYQQDTWSSQTLNVQTGQATQRPTTTPRWRRCWPLHGKSDDKS